MKGEIGFWLGVFTLALAFLALCWMIWLEVKQAPHVYYECCDHCFNEQGEYVDQDHLMDYHDEPCDVPTCIRGRIEHYVGREF